jgi:hypothetical protein
MAPLFRFPRKKRRETDGLTPPWIGLSETTIGGDKKSPLSDYGFTDNPGKRHLLGNIALSRIF